MNQKDGDRGWATSWAGGPNQKKNMFADHIIYNTCNFYLSTIIYNIQSSPVLISGHLTSENNIKNFILLWLESPSGPRPPLWGSSITLRHATLGRNPLDEWSVRGRDLYLETHNTHKVQKSTPPSGPRTRKPRNAAAADRRLRPRGQQIRLKVWIKRTKSERHRKVTEKTVGMKTAQTSTIEELRDIRCVAKYVHLATTWLFGS